MATSHKNFFKDRRGVSLLLNLLVSFSIIALLYALSLPYLKKYQSNLKLSATAKEIVADLRYAQQLTITEQVVYEVRFSQIAENYSIVKTGAATTTVKTVAFDPDVYYQEITDLTGDKVVFNSYGSVKEAGRIILTNENNRDLSINIKPSGFIQLSQ